MRMPATAPWIAPETVLTGRHVRLVPLQESFVPGLFRAGSDPELWKYVPSLVRTEADMARYVRMALADRDKGESFPFVIQAIGADRILGSTRFYALSRQNRNLEIGYTWIDPSAWRSAVNTECKYLLLRHAFETLGCVRVALRTDMRNRRSQRAIERLGAVREGVLRKHMILGDGYVRDTVYYSVIDEEWPKVKAFLESEVAKPGG
jgi:RimJ/RimL family protein N-acetyltransferase